MFKTYLLSAFIALLTFTVAAQQFVGMPNRAYSTIQQVPNNPAWVNSAEKGMEIHVFGVSTLAGTNAYTFKKASLLSGGSMRQDTDYYKDLRKGYKYGWGNVDVLGPAVTFNYKDHNFGVYTRFRGVARAGNIKETEFNLIGDMLPSYYNVPLNYTKAGFSSHTFGEVGLTYGQTIHDDYYHVIRVGATVKYMMGFSAGSFYSNNLKYIQSSRDSLVEVTGDLNALYTYNVNPYNDYNNGTFNIGGMFQRAGKGSLGLDIGAQYQYHPNGNYDGKQPYLYSIAASITDIGRLTYFADTGSGKYTINNYTSHVDVFDLRDGATTATYTGRLRAADSALTLDKAAKTFKIGLPTAFRLNVDYNATDRLNLAFNLLLNLRGNGGDRYKTGYVNCLNITPSYGSNKFKVNMPLTFAGYQTVMMGIGLQAGPLYLGSNSLFSTLLSTNIKNADFYMGVAFKIKKNIPEFH